MTTPSSVNRDAMMRYCKAQAELNSLNKARAEEEKLVSERVRTYRSLLNDELQRNRLTCCEIIPDDAVDPVYVRVKAQKQVPKLDAGLFINILRSIDLDQLASKAEKCGHDLPRMYVSIVSDEIKHKHTRRSGQTAVSITACKERGFSLGTNATPVEVRRLANHLLKARDELKSLRHESKKLKRPHEEEQHMVQEEVKETLRAVDPVNKVQRVHMTQDGHEWVYFLRCKESSRPEALGMRKAFPLLEAALARSLESNGFDRGFTEGLRLTPNFWEEVSTHLTEDINKTQTPKETSRLTLERGAPRCSRG